MARKVMTKRQLVSLIAEKVGLTRVVVSEVLDLITSKAIAETKKNGQFVIPEAPIREDICRVYAS